MSAVRLDDKRSSYLTLKWSATVWIISSGVISFFASGEIRSFNVYSANSTVIGVCESLENAESLVNAPSSSLILDLIWVAT